MNDVGPLSVTFSLADLGRQVLSNTPAYWSGVKAAPTQFKIKVCQDVAQACLDHGLTLPALSTLSMLDRLPANETHRTPALLAVRSDVERERPWHELLPANYRLVTVRDDEYHRILKQGEFSVHQTSFRTTVLGQQLFRMAAYGRAADLSFILMHRTAPLVHVRCAVHLDEGITDALAPVRIETATSLSGRRTFHAVEVALDALAELGTRAGANNILLQDQDIGPLETDVGRAVRLRGYVANLCISLAVDLTANERTLWLAIRKSFRPLITRSAETISVCYFNAERPDEHVLACWASLRATTDHTLTVSLVNLIVALIADGKGEISAGFSPDGRCIGVVVVLDDEEKTLYYNGHFVRDPEGRRHSHFMLHDAIGRAKVRGSHRFYLSYFDNFPNQTLTQGVVISPDPMIEKIRFFMRGFTTVVERHLTYRKAL